MKLTSTVIYGVPVLFVAALVQAEDTAQTSTSASQPIERVAVFGRQLNLLGQSSSASEGIVGAGEIEARPLLRTGEVLEFVPGMMVTQHSGSGKANQYFLRGFNLDHGTDFATTVDGMPINMRSHGHGQGYTDLNFLIPELIGQIHYYKGAYYPEVGDFSGAGSAAISLTDDLPYRQMALTLGEYGYQRLLATGQQQWQDNKFIFGGELQRYDGPWRDVEEDVRKVNAVGRYLTPVGNGQLAVTAMAYSNDWNSADQIPERAVTAGIIDEYGSLDTNLGGDSSRYSLSASYVDSDWQASAYVIRSRLNLFSNFTYFLDNPVDGDEFQQVDNREIWGGKLARDWHVAPFGITTDITSGIDVRYDHIGKVALYHTKARQQIGTVRDDAVDEFSSGLFGKLEAELTDDLKLRLGARYDYYNADVDSDNTLNSGNANDGIWSLKGGLSYLVSDDLELYASAGQGFHSNDARGATIKVDPATGEAVNKVDLLVRSTGAELGFRYYDRRYINLSAAFWYLDLDSELLYVGDAGTTEPSRASRRYGLEISAYYWLNDAFSVDAELAVTRARFTEDETLEGKYVDGTVPWVASAGINYEPDASGIHAALRLRYLGKRTLDSFKEHEADATTLVNLSLGYAYQDWDVKAELLNLFNSDDHDIDYWYSSRLSGEDAEGVEDLHYHPVEPRMLRLSVSYHY
ncbi:TonB-dependent receptor [Shewanella fodinae]|uniref:Outer membrane receptor protein involved in Fe transport n=1 Tax=Shewanella fodinae TaxID=552357 RepID=A0A4R2FHI4_9GAMM|nr:TonB-dependent receptor [Shewanella fodinae]TCN90311.1 outer membrane receptor protein involved in Fe transport [Shewanella fodinae]